MLIPTFVYFMINNYLPMLGVYFAFTSFNFRDGLFASPFVGLKNFEFLVKADLFRLTKNTILYNAIFIGIGNVLQIFFAILVSRIASKWYKKTSQTLMFMPYFVSFVILKVIVYNVFEYQHGLINNLITSSGADKIDFYNTPSYWPLLITLFYLWKNIGYGMVVYLATITGIDHEIYEAAKVDGANDIQQIRYITLPHIKPTFIILLLYALGSIMKGQFELFYQLIGNNGVLFNITDIFDTYVYRITMTQPLSIGLGTAAGLYQSLFGFLIIVLVNFLVKRKNPEYALF
ncbi:MAG: sugar ABC transporter permease [Lachnospiraceae bacterium]|nr:sugar ABC transporter permease [Lachnospiraceae bacterium]